jgi:hypothetical protein
MGTDFVLSTRGEIYGIVAASLACAAITVWLIWAGFIHKLGETASSNVNMVASVLVVMAVSWLFSWLILARAVPAAAAWRFSEEEWIETRIAPYLVGGVENTQNGYFVLVELPGHDGFERIEWSEYRRLKGPVPAAARIHRSWAGTHVLELQSFSDSTGPAPTADFSP